MTSGLQSVNIADDTIDLRAAILVMLRFWPLLVVMTLLASATTYVLLAGQKPLYEARVGVIITQMRTEAALEPRIRTVVEEDSRAQRSALAGLVKNAAIAERVIAMLGDRLPPGMRNAAALMRSIAGRNGTGDLIEIVVRSTDPAVAVMLANAWGQEYERYVNALYSTQAVVSVDMAAQVQRVEADYAAAQQALTDFATSNRIAELTRLIDEKQAAIQDLQTARQSAVSTVINETVNARVKMVESYLTAQAENAQLAFNKDRQARLEMYNRLAQAELRALGAAFDQQFNEKLDRLDRAFAEKGRLERLLSDARALESQIAVAGEASAQSNALAVLLLKAQVFASSAALPGNLQLNVDTAGAQASAESQRLDVAALIQVMETRLQQLDANIQGQLAALLAGEEFSLLEAMRATNLTVASSLTETLAGEVAVSPGVTSSLTVTLPTLAGVTTLSDAVLQSYLDLLGVGALAQAGQGWAAGSPLATELTRLYSQLFDPAALLPIVGQSAETPLDASFEQVIGGLEREVRQLQGQREQEQARQRELTSARDRAWEAFDAVARKATELDIASAVTNTVVRFAAPAVQPDRPLDSRRWLFTVIAGGLGLVLAAGLALTVNYLSPEFAGRVSARDRR